jgi:hypothetical protein
MQFDVFLELQLHWFLPLIVAESSQSLAFSKLWKTIIHRTPMLNLRPTGHERVECID